TAYVEEVRRRATALGQLKPGGPNGGALTVHLDNPAVYLGALIGILLVFWFIARSIGMVTRSARRLIDEVRRQMGAQEAPGRARHGASRPSGREPPRFVPDHEACVEVVARGALRQ